MTLYNGQTHHFPALTQDPVDECGAGEAAISAFAVSVAEGDSLEKAAFLANRAAGKAVQKFGTNVLKRDEVWW
jgi:bifunctional ADP-heptose synthase (sugar kinase/adenylyltransferase)